MVSSWKIENFTKKSEIKQKKFMFFLKYAKMMVA